MMSTVYGVMFFSLFLLDLGLPNKLYYIPRCPSQLPSGRLVV